MTCKYTYLFFKHSSSDDGASCSAFLSDSMSSESETDSDDEMYTDDDPFDYDSIQLR